MIKEKRIAVFVKNLTSGGAEKQAVLLAKSLANEMNVFFVVFNGKKVHTKYLQMMEGTNVSVIQFHGGHLKRFYRFIRFLRQEDIKIIFSYLTAANLYACLASLFTGCKVVTGLRNAYYTPGKRYANLFLTNYLATATISNCYSGLDFFVKHGFNPHKLFVIPNCLADITPYVDKPCNNHVRIITIGRFCYQKDYETAIRSISLLRKKNTDFTYAIVGYGELESKIRDWIKKYNVEDIVAVHINPNNIEHLLEGSDIYFSTSLFEGTSNSMMEAMNANLPIVATNVGDNPYLVHDRENGFIVSAKDASTMADCLYELIKSPHLRQEYGLCSKQILQKNHSEEIFKQRYLQIIKSIV